MNTLRHIRKEVFGISQSEMAEIAHVSQGTVSKWEKQDLSPNQAEMALIRSKAAERGIDWNDSWFFETPEGVQ